MAMAALGNMARRLASQRPAAIHRAEVPRRLFHRGSSAVGRAFSLPEEQRRLVHGGSPAVGRTYSRQYHSSRRVPITFMGKVKAGIQVLDRALIFYFRAALLGAIVFDLSGPRYIPRLTRVLLRLLKPPEERVPRGGKEAKERVPRGGKEAEAESS